MRRVNSSIKVDYFSEKGIDNIDRTYFAYIPLENMVCYAAAESYDCDNDIDSAKLAVESVLTAFERKPSFKNLRQYIRYAHDQIVANSVKNKLEAAITVVVSDYTRIRYASCGNIKLYLLSDNAFYLKGETQTYYKHAADVHGLDKAPIAENKNLLQYLGKKGGPKPYVSPKIELFEESTMLFATCSFWERVDDVEILDAYEESDPGVFLSNVQELYLLTQLSNPTIKSYTLASLFVEKTYKEDTADKKKRRRIMMILAAVAILVAIIVYIVISLMRASDRHAMAEIESLDSEGIRYSNYGNYKMAYEQYEKASELAGKLRNNLQYMQAKRALSSLIAERWHLFDSIMIGDGHMEGGDYGSAFKAFQDAQDAYYEVYREAGTHSGLMVSQILSGKLELVGNYIAADELTKIGQIYVVEELYQEALAKFKEAESIAKAIGDLTLRTKLMTLIFETESKISSTVEAKFISNIRALMTGAEEDLDFELALKYSEFILDVYRDMGIADDQAQEDNKRIMGKIDLEKEAAENINWARTMEAASRYEDARSAYNRALGCYIEMGMKYGNERYKAIEDHIDRIDALLGVQNMEEANNAQADGTEGNAQAEGPADG